MTSIRFDQLPQSPDGFSKLFTSYVHDFQSVRDYFEVDYRQQENFPGYAEYVSKRFKHRAELVDILLDQNQQIGASELTLENIRALSREGCTAVVTGQQVGILGGPLYTVYKAATAIRLAQRLNAGKAETAFVPVFWLEGEDHDFEEVNGVHLLNAESAPSRVEYLIDGKPLEKNPGPVGEIPINGSVQSFFEKVQSVLQPSEFKKPLIDLLQAIYSEGSTFARSFATLMNRLFPGKGLVFINSNDSRVKRLLSPVFVKELSGQPAVSRLIIERSAELEEKFHAQIKPKAVNLFCFFKGGRYLIEPRGEDFTLKGTRQHFPKEEILRMAAETPELLSPSVALRPICQDTVLPTVAYVAGPGEVAYFAQLRPVYEHFDVPMPIIYPRASVTILEKRHEKTVEKYELDILELFGNPERLSRKVVDLVSEVKIDEMFGDASKRMGDLLNEMKFGLNYIDATLLGSLETTRTKIEQQLEALREKTVAAQKQRHEVALRQLARVLNTVAPNGGFQERELNVSYFMNKYGLEFVSWLAGELSIDCTGHQIVRMS